MDPRAFPRGYFADPVIGDANLSVYIGGLALINRKENKKNWAAQFIDHLADHRLNIRLLVSENGRPTPPEIIIEDAAAGQISKVEVAVKSEGQMPASYYNNISDNRHYGYMADFSSDELHGSMVRKNTNKPCELVGFKLNGGKLYTARLAQQNGRNPDLYRFDKPGNIARYIGHWAGIDLVAKKGSKLSIKINGRDLAFNGGDGAFQNGRRFIFIIDNMCAQSGCESTVDFAYYYRRSFKGEMGMVDETPIELMPDFGSITPQSFKVACNAALATANDT